MRNIYVIRHGQSMANIDPAVYKTTSDHAIPLSEHGHEQAKSAGVALRNLIEIETDSKIRLWTSPFLRARQTSHHIYDAVSEKFSQIELRENVNLCEQQFGLLNQLSTDEINKYYPFILDHYNLRVKQGGKFWARVPLGESRFDVALRVQQAFTMFYRDADRNGIEDLIVVCHGSTMRAFIMMWLHLPFEWFEQEENPNNCDIFHIHQDSVEKSKYIYRTPSFSAFLDMKN